MEKEDDDATACCCRLEPSRRFGDVNEESLLAASIIMILSPIISPIVSAYIPNIALIAYAHPNPSKSHQNFCEEGENTF